MPHFLHVLILIVQNASKYFQNGFKTALNGPNQEMRQKWTVFYQYLISTLGFERFLFEERLKGLSKVLIKYS